MANNNGNQIPNNNGAYGNVDLSLRLGLPFYERLRLDDEIRMQQHGQVNGPIHFEPLGNFGGPYGPDPENLVIYNGHAPAGAEPVGVKMCEICRRTNTPLWRRGPNGPQTLCNACGLRHARVVRRNEQR